MNLFKKYFNIAAFAMMGVVIVSLVTSGMSYDPDTSELEETNEALREKVVEVTAENKWLRERIDILEEE